MKNNNTYKIIIGILIIIILVLGFLYINKNNSLNNETNYSELESSNKELQEEKEKLLKQVNELNSNITELEDKVETLSNNTCTDTSSLEKEISNLKSQITTLNSKISSLESSNNEYKNTIKNLNTEIINLNNQINNLKIENETYTVFYSVDGETIYSERVKKGNDVQNIPSIPTKGNYSSEWNNDGTNIQNDIVIYANYYYLITLTREEDIDDSILTLNTYSFRINEDDTDKTLILNNDYLSLGGEDIVIATIIDSMYVAQGWRIDGVLYNASSEYEVTSNLTIEYYATYGCIVKGSKITMADGSTKNIEDIKIGDEVLSYDYYNGTIDSTKVTTLIKGNNLARIFKVTLENGNEIKIVDAEYLFDTDNKEFINININTYESYIGRNVMVNNNGSISTSKIVNIEYSKEYVEHYTLYTANSVDYIANNIIALAPFKDVNVRYTIADDYKIDMDIYNSDVNKYGLYTYEEFKDVCTEETFINFHVADFKITAGKTNYSFEQIKEDIRLLQEEIDYYNSLNN